MTAPTTKGDMMDSFEGLKANGISVLIDLRTCELTLRETMEVIEDFDKKNPGMEIWMDGDAYAIVYRPLDHLTGAA